MIDFLALLAGLGRRDAQPAGCACAVCVPFPYLEQVAAIFRSLDLEELVRIDAARDEDAVARDVMTAVDRVVVD